MFGFLRKIFSPIGRKMASLFRIGRKTTRIPEEFVDLGAQTGMRFRVPQTEASVGQGFYATPGLALKNFKYPDRPGMAFV